MPPTIILIRHAQALHNADHKNQCTDLRKNLAKRFRDVTDAAIVVSPMRRTIETAQLALKWLIEKGVTPEADARWQENSAKPCDTGSPIPALEKEFPTVDFSKVDPVYPEKRAPAGAKYFYTRQAILARGRSAIEDLYSRPEKYIFVVSHSAFLRVGLTGFWWHNADYRIFDLEPAAASGDVSGLRQWESTLSGGLGWSRTGTVMLGYELPDDTEAPRDE